MRFLPALLSAALILGCATTEDAWKVHWRKAEHFYGLYLAEKDDPEAKALYLERARYYDRIAANEFAIALGGYYSRQALTSAALANGMGAAYMDSQFGRYDEQDDDE